MLFALEGLQGQCWLDLTFGLLPGWWRFADRYRAEGALADEAAWREALADAGFGEVALLGHAGGVRGGAAGLAGGARAGAGGRGTRGYGS